MNTEQLRAELLPCPFCGGEAFMEEHPPHKHSDWLVKMGMPEYSAGSFTIKCVACECGMIHESRDGVVAAWNRRAALQSQDEDIFSPTSLTGLSKDELIRQLQWALNYWMPNIADDGTPDGERAAREAYLLLGMQAPVGREEENTPTYWERVSNLQSQDREDAARLVGITVMNFMGPHAKWSDDAQRHAEPVGYRWRDGNEDTWKYVDGLPPEDSIGHYEVELLYARAANKPAEPVKRKRRYAQGTALGEFGIIPMCDQVDDKPVNAPPATAYCQHPHCQTTGGCQGLCSKKQAEPAKVPSEADAKHVQDFINCDGMGAVIVEGPQYSAVVRALLARYGQAAQPAPEPPRSD